MDNKEYLIKKIGHLSEGNPNAINPWLDPCNDDHISECSVCKKDYENFLEVLKEKRKKKGKIEFESHEYFVMSHTPYCLWYDFFLTK